MFNQNGLSVAADKLTLPQVLVLGTGEYVVGRVAAAEDDNQTDKSAGIIAPVLFDLQRRGCIGEVSLCGRQGDRFPAIRRHLQQALAERYVAMPVAFRAFPADEQRDEHAYVSALDSLSRGDLVIVATPDDWHFDMAKQALQRGLHVLVVKPLVKTLAHHQQLVELAQQQQCLLMVEVHKRWDPFYLDAWQRAQELGEFSYMSSYMSQPKYQLQTFAAWAGISSDISYYLNTHHIDWHVWCLAGRARPIAVSAVAANGLAQQVLERPLEDVIGLQVVWQNLPSGHLGFANYTASWIAPTSDVHSQQRFFYQAHGGEVQVDQAHRGYLHTSDTEGLKSRNPLFFTYEALHGEFNGQGSYGYRSIESFISAARQINSGDLTLAQCQGRLPTAADTLQVSAILEAGKRSLAQQGRSININYARDTSLNPESLD